MYRCGIPDGPCVVVERGARRRGRDARQRESRRAKRAHDVRAVGTRESAGRDAERERVKATFGPKKPLLRGIRESRI